MQDTHIKTLVIRFSSVGDIVLSSPLVRALRYRFPQMQLDFLVKERYADLVRYSPHLSNVIAFPRSGGIVELLKLRREIRLRHYGTILDIHGSLRSRLLTFGLAGVRRVKKRIIARTILIHFKRDVYSWFGGAPGIARRYMETAASEGLTDERETVELFVPPAVQESADALLSRSGINSTGGAIGVCPSARHFTKIWPEDRFAAAASALAQRWELPVLLFGSGEDATRSRRIASNIREISPDVQVVDLSGICSLLETAALMDRCRIVLTNDSGLMHIATARARPVVAIFGSTVRQLGFFPTGTMQRVVEHPNLPCRPCTHIGRDRCPRGHFRCMLDLTPQNVLHAANELLNGEQPPIQASTSIR
ncbi:MAG: lipopolysaccharide heptosyltransferase II [Bacteroidota bacterium]